MVNAAQAVAEGLLAAVAVHGGKLIVAAAGIQMMDHKPETAPLVQAETGVAKHGDLRHGLVGRTSSRSALTTLDTEQPAETEVVAGPPPDTGRRY